MIFRSDHGVCLRIACWLVALALAACGGGGGVPAGVAPEAPPSVPGDRVQLGRLIFGDPALSEPPGTACAACHQPNLGFAGNNGSHIGVALGSQPGAVGMRNTMTSAYSGFVPAPGFRTDNGATRAVGGHFWDGRADTLAQQALVPLLNPLEMNNADMKAVVDKIAAAPYAALFRQEFGATALADTRSAFEQIGLAIEAFERSPTLQSFSSKYDAMVRGQASLTPQEARGMALFMDAGRANCAGCHLMNPASGRPQDSLFSDFAYYATGIPRNAEIPANANPDYFDLGLCGPQRAPPALPASLPAGVTSEQFCGKFRMPTLRNVARRNAFMHNGFFHDLREVLRFYATRNSNPQRWYGPAKLPNDLPGRYLANIESARAPFNRQPGDAPALSEPEIDDLVAFLGTLNDGFVLP